MSFCSCFLLLFLVRSFFISLRLSSYLSYLSLYFRVSLYFLCVFLSLSLSHLISPMFLFALGPFLARGAVRIGVDLGSCCTAAPRSLGLLAQFRRLHLFACLSAHLDVLAADGRARRGGAEARVKGGMCVYEVWEVCVGHTSSLCV